MTNTNTNTDTQQDSIELLCHMCGQTFSTFLHQMAEQNAKVVCPNCGIGQDCKPAKSSKPTTKV